jgi:hypothetical protein
MQPRREVRTVFCHFTAADCCTDRRLFRCRYKGKRSALTCLCGYEFCFLCSRAGHAPCTCWEVELWEKSCSENIDDARFGLLCAMLWRLLHWFHLRKLLRIGVLVSHQHQIHDAELQKVPEVQQFHREEPRMQAHVRAVGCACDSCGCFDEF